MKPVPKVGRPLLVCEVERELAVVDRSGRRPDPGLAIPLNGHSISTTHRARRLHEFTSRATPGPILMKVAG